MQLNIDRLKVLGFKELQSLDDKIQSIRNSDEAPKLKQLISDIQIQITDQERILSELQGDLNKIKNKYEYYQKMYTNNDMEYNRLYSIIDYYHAKIKEILDKKTECDKIKYNWSEILENNIINTGIIMFIIIVVKKIL